MKINYRDEIMEKKRSFHSENKDKAGVPLSKVEMITKNNITAD